jgi:hypothetical protein
MTNFLILGQRLQIFKWILTALQGYKLAFCILSEEGRLKTEISRIRLLNLRNKAANKEVTEF